MLARTGAQLFSRYAFPPNDLGHCGPPGAELLLAGGSSDQVSDPPGSGLLADHELRSRAACFDGAWPYLQLLARILRSGDPLAPETVSAYWLGTEGLDRVPGADFAATVETAFGGQPGVCARLAAAPELLEAGPSHAFHVFVVYPWAGLLGSGGDVARSVLDQCRVRWGTVEWVDGERAGVRSAPLSWDGISLDLAPEQLEIRRWARGGHAFVHDLRPGDRVSLHWDWVCDRLRHDEQEALAGRTIQQLGAVNRWLAARP